MTRRLPGRSKRGDGREAIFRRRLHRLRDYGGEPGRPVEASGVLGQTGGEVPDQPAEGEDGGALVQWRAELEFLGGHEPAGAEHPAHVVAARPATVGVKINDVQGQGVEIDDQAAVVQITRDPAEASQNPVQIDQRVEDRQLRRGWQVGESLVGRCGIGTFGRRDSADEFSRSGPVDQHRAGRRLDHVQQVGQRRMIT
jgi:hypothetical protein